MSSPASPVPPVPPERLVRLEGARNFRDLGGYDGADGRQVRWGLVFRSDHLGALTEADVETIVGLGVRTVVDFQGAHERAADQQRPLSATAITRLERPILDVDDPAGGAFVERVMARTIRRFELEDMVRFYLRTLERSAPTFGEVISLVADPGQHSVVFHCRAGKDRTGLTAALLLGALGVSDEAIIDDYLLTNRYRSEMRVEVLRPQLAERGIDIDDFLPLFLAQRDAMADTLAGLSKQFGSIERYLVTAAGVSRRTVDDLRRHLLT